jgi:glutathione S-transferase
VLHINDFEEEIMKLYFATGACSLAPHIALHEARLDYTLEKVDLRTKQYSGGDYRKINPKGSVPAVELENGEILTEAVAILQYIGDQKPDTGLVPKAGTWERYRELEWLNYVSTEIHKGTFGVLFAAGHLLTSSEGLEQLRTAMKSAIQSKAAWLNEKLEGKDYLMGPTFTAADTYLYTCLRWSKLFEIQLAEYVNLERYMKRVDARPSVQTALKEQGLKPY